MRVGQQATEMRKLHSYGIALLSHILFSKSSSIFFAGNLMQIFYYHAIIDTITKMVFLAGFCEMTMKNAIKPYDASATA